MFSPVVWMKVLVFKGSSVLPHSRSCSVAPWGYGCILASPKMGRTVEHALGTEILSGVGSFRYMPSEEKTIHRLT